MRQPILPEQPDMQNVPFESVADTATIELLLEWRRQDFTTDPELLLAAEQELAEFKSRLNATRSESGEPPLFP